MEEEKWTDVTKDCVIRWWHMEGKGSLIEILHNETVIAVVSPSGGNMTTSPRVRGYYKIEIGESDIPAKWFTVFNIPRPEGEERGRGRRPAP